MKKYQVIIVIQKFGTATATEDDEMFLHKRYVLLHGDQIFLVYDSDRISDLYQSWGIISFNYLK